MLFPSPSLFTRASAAAAFGAGVGAIPGAGLGTAAGTETIELLGRLAGTEIERDIGSYAVERLGDVAFGAIGQAVGPLVLKGAKRLVNNNELIKVHDTAYTIPSTLNFVFYN